MDFRLDIVEEGKRRVTPLGGEATTVGRGGDNVVVINDPRSSRHHCRIVRTPQGYLLEDLGSRNGTIMNGSPVKQSLLKPGSVFTVGNVRFSLVEAGADRALDSSGPETRSENGDRGASGGSSVEKESPEEDLLDIDGGGDDEGAGDVLGDDGDGSHLLLEETHRASADVGPDPGEAETVARTVRADSRQMQAAVPARAPGGPGPALVWAEGPLEGKRISLEKATGKDGFVLFGRSRFCDVPLKDNRTSSRHAQIVFEKGVFYVEDLESTNGTVLNERTVKRAVLSPGDVLKVGNSVFHVEVPPPPAALRGPRGGPAGEEFVQFDMEKFLERDRTQHPGAVIALVVIVVVVCYFTIGITQRLVERNVLDPAGERNQIARNWSFEEVPAPGGAVQESGGPVPGWKLGENDRGVLRLTRENARHPGLQALSLSAGGGEDVCRATYASNIGLSTERVYRLQGYVANDGAFAAGLMVEWLRPSQDGSVEVGRSFSDTARQRGEAVDVDQLVLAPPSASEARVSCFLLGGSGAGTFDRVSFGLPEEAKGADAAPVFQPLRAGPDEDPVQVALQLDGTFSIGRRRKLLLSSVWIALSPESDPRAYGPRLAAVRMAEGDASLFDSEVPDLTSGRWVTVETKGYTSGTDAILEWHAAASPDAQAAKLSLYLELRDKAVPVALHGADGIRLPGATADAPLPPVNDIVIGERDERVSLAFGEPLRVAVLPHPTDAARSVLRVDGGAQAMKLLVAHGSRLEASRARSLALEAEEEYRAGRAGAAIRLLSKLEASFPAEKAEAAQAAARIAEWRRTGAEALKGLEAELQVLRETPSRVVHDLLVQRGEALRASYEGTPEGEAASRLVESAKGLLGGIEARRSEEELKALFEKARQHFAAGELALAELLFRWVAAEGDAQMKRTAEHTLKIIEGRRATAQKILLQ